MQIYDNDYTSCSHICGLGTSNDSTDDDASTSGNAVTSSSSDQFSASYRSHN